MPIKVPIANKIEAKNITVLIRRPRRARSRSGRGAFSGGSFWDVKRYHHSNADLCFLRLGSCAMSIVGSLESSSRRDGLPTNVCRDCMFMSLLLCIVFLHAGDRSLKAFAPGAPLD